MNLIIDNLSFERNNQILFADLNFAIHSGELLQVQGANGCGKSTLLRILAGFIEPRTGKILCQNNCIFTHREEYHQQLHYIGHQNGLKPNLTILENLQYISALLEIKSRDQDLHIVLEKLGLAHLQQTPSGRLSAGQLRRLSLGKLLLCKKSLWILDEPTTALDTNGQILLHELLAEHLTDAGAAIIATHQDLPLTCQRLTLT